MLPYDTDVYAATLTHLGPPEVIDGLPWPVIVRRIPGTERSDAMGPWPYGSPPEAGQLAAALPALRARGLVTLTAVLRPDCPVDAAGLLAVGAVCAPLKPHFIHDAAEALPPRSKKTRYNLAAAHRRWQVERLDLPAAWPAVAALHDELAHRRSLSKIARLEAGHFERLAAVPGVEGLAVFEQGALVAALVVVRSSAAVHFHCVVGSDLGHRERAHYALYDAALAAWGGQNLLCLGGAPAGEAGEGIGKFKGRFATSTRPVTLLKVILDAEACATLTGDGALPGYFPPYRRPGE